MSCRDMYIKLSNVVGTAQASYDMVDQNGIYVFQRKTHTELSTGITVSVGITASRFTLSSFTQSGSYGPCWNPIDPNTLLLLHFDNNSTDSSSFNRAVTINGSAHYSATQSKFGGYSVRLTRAAGQTVGVLGSRSVVSIPDSNDFAFGTQSWTIDYWIYNDTAFASGVICGQSTDNSNFFLWDVSKTGTDTGKTSVYKAGGTEHLFEATFIGFTQSQWHHVAYVRSGNNWYVFHNGVSLTLTYTFNNPGISIPNYTSNFVIGSGLGRMNNDITAYIDEFRISNIARWTSNFTPPTTPY